MGVIGLTRALSATLGDDGITINAVVASLTHTAMSEGVPEPIMRDSVGRQVIHRIAEPADIAGAVIMVASDEAGGSLARRSWQMPGMPFPCDALSWLHYRCIRHLARPNATRVPASGRRR
jgi:NAD(P)-dependent dehydrogenase (short-subunit alcohol dehydrogenase family)